MMDRACLPEPPCDCLMTTFSPVLAFQLVAKAVLTCWYSSRVGSYDTLSRVTSAGGGRQGSARRGRSPTQEPFLEGHAAMFSLCIVRDPARTPPGCAGRASFRLCGRRRPAPRPRSVVCSNARLSLMLRLQCQLSDAADAPAPAWPTGPGRRRWGRCRRRARAHCSARPARGRPRCPSWDRRARSRWCPRTAACRRTRSRRPPARRRWVRLAALASDLHRLRSSGCTRPAGRRGRSKSSPAATSACGGP